MQTVNCLTMSTLKNDLRLRLEKLECHFTWGLMCPPSRLQRVRYNLEDIRTEEGYTWLGHINNLLGFIRYRLGGNDLAIQYLCKAVEAFRQINNTVSEEGPWLLVNYANQAWVNFHLDNLDASQDYLEKVYAVMREHPVPSSDNPPREGTSSQEDPLHPEVYAEKAWTLVKFSSAKSDGDDYDAIKCYQKAIAMKPDRTEWQTSLAIALHGTKSKCTPEKEAEIAEKIRQAMEADQENTFLASIYLQRLAENRQPVCKHEIRTLAEKILSRREVGLYSGLRVLLRIYRMCLTHDEAVDLAQEALDRDPENRYLKASLMTSYKWKIIWGDDVHSSVFDRAISLFQEVIALYPDACLKNSLDLANIYAKSGRDGADGIYAELLGRQDLEPTELQMLHNYYAQYLNYYVRDRNRSINHHMKVVEIQNESRFRQKSIKILSKIVQRNQNYRCAEIRNFLERHSVTL